MNNVIFLDQLFHKRLFHVPDYQRGFSWERQQVNEFLEDLELLIPGRYHYTGTVVLHSSGEVGRMDEDGNTFAVVDIVDGQQRITTIVLLLDAIRRALRQLGPSAKNLANGIGKNYVATTESNGQRLYRLSLNDDCDHFFKNNVLAEAPSIEGAQITSELRLAAAKEIISQYVQSNSGGTPEDSEQWLRELYEKVATQLRFSLYEVEHEADVGVIFEVMNNRGKPLSELEKVKNYLLYVGTKLHVDNNLGKAVNDAWAQILEQLMAAGLVTGQDENRLLRTHWLIQFDPRPRRWTGSKRVKEQFDLRSYQGHDGHQVLRNELHRYVQGLRETCISFCDAYRPDRSDAIELYHRSTRIKVTSSRVDWQVDPNRGLGSSIYQ